MEELAALCERWDEDEQIRCIVIAGSDEWFAAGADIKAMATRTLVETLTASSARFWERLAGDAHAADRGRVGLRARRRLRAGPRLRPDRGLRDRRVRPAGDPARHHPRRRRHAAARARDREAARDGAGAHRAGASTPARRTRLGLVNTVTRKKEWLDTALELAEVVARRPPLAVRFAKQAVLAADETPLSAGISQERRLYELAMATEDRVEGMNAFIEKRRPEFRGR